MFYKAFERNVQNDTQFSCDICDKLTFVFSVIHMIVLYVSHLSRAFVLAVTGLRFRVVNDQLRYRKCYLHLLLRL